MSGFDPNKQSRIAAGVSDGGQFSTGARGEPEVSLTPGGAPNLRGRATDVAQVAAQMVDAGRLIADDGITFEQKAADVLPLVPRRVLVEDYLDNMAAAIAGDDEQELDRLTQRLQKVANHALSADPHYRPPSPQASGPVDVVEVARDVSDELDSAQASGYLPDGLQFTVRPMLYSGGRMVHVQVDGMTDEDIYKPDVITANRRLSATALDLRERVHTIAGAYCTPGEGYYHCHVQLTDEATAATQAA